jgi:hypothetical protein
MRQFHHLSLILSGLLAFGARADTNAVFRCRAKVVDARGQPVAGAVVERYRTALSPVPWRGSWELAGRSTTDSDGAVVFTATNGTGLVLIAAKPGFSIGWASPGPFSDPEDDSLTITVTSPASVSGRVLDSAQKPVPGAAVWVRAAFWTPEANQAALTLIGSELGRRYLSARTGPDGKFRIDGLPEGTKLDLAVAKAGLAPDQPPGSLRYLAPSGLSFDAGQSNIVLTLKPAGAIAGRVVREESGAPVAGARVAVVPGVMDTGASASAVTGPDGAFRLEDLGAGECILEAQVGTNQPPELIGETVTVAVEAGATNRDVKLAVGPGGVLEVTVRDQAGDRPLKGASVQVGNQQGVMQSAAPSDKGLARFRLPPGQYPVSVYTKSERPSFAHESATVERDQTNALAITMPETSEIRITGTVLDPEGKPAPRIAVTSFPSGGRERKTDVQGHFTVTINSGQFGGRQGAQHVLVARDFEHNLAAALEVEEDATNATLRLQPGLTLAGRITDIASKPITNAEVTLMFHTDRMARTFDKPVHGDAQGRFEIAVLPPGRRYTITASAKGFGQDSRSLEDSDTDTSTRRVELEPFQLAVADQRIAGVVLGEKDKPAPGVTIYSFGPKQPRVNGRTDAQGRFSFDHVCAGPINLSANDMRQPGRSGNTIAQGGDTNITIRLGEQPGIRFGGSNSKRLKFAGVIVAPDGKPAPKVVVSLFPMFSYAQQRTDDQGRFTLPADYLPPGYPVSQHILVARDLERNLAAALDLEEDATNVDLRLSPGLTLAGRVAGANGHAVSNAQAQVMFRTDRMSSPLGQAVRADAEGRFEIKALPPDRRYSVTVSARGFGQDSHNADAPEAGSNRLELEPFELLVADQRIAGVVLDADEKPVAGAHISIHGAKQPMRNSRTDSNGRFSIDKVCPGDIHIFANGSVGDRGFTSANAQGGDTNVIIRLNPAGSRVALAAPRPVSLAGKPLPDLAPLGLAPADAPEGRPLLVLLLDAEQRPCRRALRLLADQAAGLKQQSLGVVVLQAGAMTDEAFAAWKQETAPPFPVGRFKDKDPAEKASSAWGATALPWFILADKSHRVAAEGFALEELDAKVKGLR